MTRLQSTLLNVAALIILGSLFLMTGCSGDDPVAPVPPSDKALWEAVQQMPDSWWGFDRSGENLGVTRLPFPNSPEQVMENFRTVYETQDVLGYLQIMHPDFLTILQQETTDEFPDVGTTLDRYEEQNIHKRMFLGQAVTDPEGNLVPGVQNIAFQVLQPSGPWEVTSDDDIFPNSLYCLYEVQVLFDRGQSFSTLRVEGMIKFYVVSREFEHNGQTYEFYQMNGQLDLTGGFKSTESVNWGSVKALYR